MAPKFNFLYYYLLLILLTINICYDLSDFQSVESVFQSVGGSLSVGFLLGQAFGSFFDRSNILSDRWVSRSAGDWANKRSDPNDRPSLWPTDQPNDQMIDRKTDWPTDQRPTEQKTDHKRDRAIKRPTDRHTAFAPLSSQQRGNNKPFLATQDLIDKRSSIQRKRQTVTLTRRITRKTEVLTNWRGAAVQKGSEPRLLGFDSNASSSSKHIAIWDIWLPAKIQFGAPELPFAHRRYKAGVVHCKGYRIAGLFEKRWSTNRNSLVERIIW